MLKKVLIGVAVVLAVLVVAISTRPDTFSLTRETTVNAPAEVVMAQIADFNQWHKWSPWAKLDPNQQTKIEGAPGAVGSSYSWVGNDKVGEGKMTLTALEPAKRAEIKLEFLKPFASTNTTEFTVAPSATGQKVTWTMSGKANFMSKAMSMVKSMDEMVGPDFEKGLAGIKTAAEADAQAKSQEAAAVPSEAPVAPAAAQTH
jgi:uncharacterized protein YndB with AHSA1/START domain